MRSPRPLVPPAVLVLLVLAAGCVTVSKSVLATGFEPVPKMRVQVYFADDSIPENTRVAILSAKGDSEMTDEAKMIDKLREEAGKLGANAIILSEVKEPGTGERVVNGIFNGMPSGQRRGMAIAIYVPSLAGKR